MAQILDHGPEFWPRMYWYMPWGGTQYPSSTFGTALMGCPTVYQYMMGWLEIYRYMPWDT